MNRRQRLGAGYIFSRLALVFLLAATFFPLVMMVNMSLKPTVLISTDFLSLPADPYLQNFSKAFEFVKRPVLNSLYICALSLLGVLFNATLSGYAFARMHFRGKTALYSILVAVLMVPATITIVPQFIVISRMGLINTYWALILPYIGSQQVLGVILCCTTFKQIPQELFDAAKIDGADELQTMTRIGLPLLRPTLITVGIQVVVAIYNDYIWPTVALTGGDDIKTFCQIVYNNSQGLLRTDIGLLCAAFILGTIPLGIATCCCLKYYLRGMVAGAIKG